MGARHLGQLRTSDTYLSMRLLHFFKLALTSPSLCQFFMPTLGVVSSFGTKGKKTAWDAWKSYGEVTPSFFALSTGPAQITDEDVVVLERFTIANNCSQKKDESWMPFPRPEQPLCSILKGLYTKVGTAEARCSKLLLTCHPPGTGDGSTPKTGNQCGPRTLPEASTASRELLRCGC